MKSFSIHDLEKNIDPDVFHLGLELIENGTLSTIKELENNLWLLKVDDSTEVELLLARNRVKSYSCDCDVARGEEICHHLAAAMILLRRVKAAPVKKTKSTARSSKPKKMTTANILSMASNDEIKDFVRKYARSNRQFSVALKTKFAHLFQTEDLETKYNQVLETIIKAQVGRSSYLKTVRLRRLLKNLDELLNQAEDASAKRHFGDVFALLSAFISHVVPVIWKTKGDDIVLRLERAFSIMNQLVDKELSPELEQKMREKLLAECPKFKYRSGETTARFFYALEVLYKRAGMLPQLADFVAEQTNDTTWGRWLSAKWQVLRFRLAIALEQEEIKQHILSNVLKDRNLFDKLLADAETRNDKETLKVLVELVKNGNANFTHKITAETEKILLDIAKEEKNKRDIIKYSKRLFLDTLDMQYYELVKQNSSRGRWKSNFTEIMESMTSSNKLWVHKEAVAEILIKEKKIKELFSYISKIKSLALLSKYGQQLLAADKNQYLKIFDFLLMDFAKHHLGVKNAQIIVRVLNELKDNKEKDFVNTMVLKLRTEFPERKSLLGKLVLV